MHTVGCFAVLPTTYEFQAVWRRQKDVSLVVIDFCAMKALLERKRIAGIVEGEDGTLVRNVHKAAGNFIRWTHD